MKQIFFHSDFTPDERAQITKILECNDFKRSSFGRGTIELLASRGTAGATGQELAQEVWKMDIYTTEDNRIRTAIGEYREKLKTYYAKDGHKDPLLVEIAANPYRLVFQDRGQRKNIGKSEEGDQLTVVVPADAAVSSLNEANEEKIRSWPAPTAAQVKPEPASKQRIWVGIIGLLVVAATIGLWKYYMRPCTTDVSVVAPPENGVGLLTPVRTKRTRTPWFCGCRDYIVVQPNDNNATWFVASQLGNGDHPSVTARFGEPDTKLGTEFYIFVLTSHEDMKVEQLQRNFKLPDEDQSDLILVTRTH